MRTLRQRLIEKEINNGKTYIKSKDPADYVKAVFMISKDFDLNNIDDQSKVLSKKYVFKIPKNKFPQAIEFLNSLSGGASAQANNKSNEQKS